MRLITQNGRIIASALDTYTGASIEAPPDFDTTRMGDYRVDEDGNLTLMPATVAVPPRAITYWAFRKRFTHAERVGLELAALDDPSADIQQRQRSAGVRVYLADAAAADWIDLDDADSRDSVATLESLGLLSEGRAVEIIDAPVLAAERPGTLIT